MKQAAETPVGLTRRSLFRALAGASGVFAAKTGMPASSPREDNIYTRVLGVRPLLSVRGHTTSSAAPGCRPRSCGRWRKPTTTLSTCTS